MLYKRIIEGGTINEPEGKPDPQFALPSTVNWMRALVVLIEDKGVNFNAATQFYQQQGKRSMDALVENTVLEQLFLGLHHLSADMAFFSPEEDEWLDNEVAADPHAIFVDSFNKTGEILATHGGEDGGHLINRMVFAQQVSALEAYLGDTLIKAVQAKPEALARLVAADKDLNAEKFTLADIAANPGLLGEKVAAYLRAILYHNLAKVDFLYRTALDVRVLGDKANNALLLQAIRHRHDCVHRNGMDKDGNHLTVFTKAHVQDVANAMRTLVDRIETEVWGTPVF